MAFLLNGGGSGCPPTEAPPAGYDNPFRFNASGDLWLRNSFDSFRFHGAARHDVTSVIALGSADAPTNGNIAAGSFSNVPVTNNLSSDVVVMVAYDLYVDISVRGSSLVSVGLTGYYNGAALPRVSTSSVRTGMSTYYARVANGYASNPFNPGIESGGSATMVLAPGASATISAQLDTTFVEGAPTGFDVIYLAACAVRVYSYVVA